MLAMAGMDMMKASHKVLNEVARRIKRTNRNKRSKRSNWPAKSKLEPKKKKIKCLKVCTGANWCQSGKIYANYCKNVEQVHVLLNTMYRFGSLSLRIR